MNRLTENLFSSRILRKVTVATLCLAFFSSMIIFIAASCGKPDDPEKAELERLKKECAAKPGENFWNDELNICQHDVELNFTRTNADEIYPWDKLKAQANIPEIRKVYIVPQGTFMGMDSVNFAKGIIDPLLKPALGVDPKVWGKGDFDNWERLNAQQKAFLKEHGWNRDSR
jgi:hypothetical protein